MPSFQKPGHGSSYVGSGSPSNLSHGKWGKKSEEGKIFSHPRIKGHYVLRHDGFDDISSHNRESLEDRLTARKKMGWKNSREEYEAQKQDGDPVGTKPLRSFKEFLKDKE